jgi:hypothetical protein
MEAVNACLAIWNNCLAEKNKNLHKKVKAAFISKAAF